MVVWTMEDGSRRRAAEKRLVLGQRGEQQGQDGKGGWRWEDGHGG